MSIKRIFLLGISVSLLTALPALAYQGGGAQRGAQRSGQSTALNQQSRTQIYGSQLMTPAERRSYRNQMRSLKTAQEREAFRQQHHEQMQKRAAERGVSLPDTPPRQGGGMGPGGGMGQGAGAQQRTQQQTEQQQQNQGQDQQIRQQQRTEQKTQPAKENKDGN